MNNYVTKFGQAIMVLVMIATVPACSKEDVAPPLTATIHLPAAGASVARYQFIRLAASSNQSDARFEWKVNGTVRSTTDSLSFISDSIGTYTISLTATGASTAATSVASINVTREATPYTKSVAKVFDYFPAPGQFVNTMPAWTEGETAEEVRVKAESALKGGGGIHLGAYGGYVIVGFDHVVINKPGQPSFKVLGNAFANWSEPGIIEVSVDANGNGLPDDEWFEIAGSEYHHATTIKNYEITYYKPAPGQVPVPDENNSFLSDINYIKWTDNQGKTGYVVKNIFHDQSYYPGWKGSSITFKGTKLTADNIVDLSGTGSYYVSPAFEFGYADNWPNTDARTGIQLDWAVNKEGKPVKLAGIHFVKVYTGMLGDAGWLGEVSTEVMGIEDVNLK